MHERNVNPRKHCPCKVWERSSLFPCIPRCQPHPFLNPACVQCLSLNKRLLGSGSKCYEHKTLRKEGRRVMTLQAMTSVHRTETTCPHVIPSYTCFPCSCHSSPGVLDETVKPFINSSLSSNYTVSDNPWMFNLCSTKSSVGSCAFWRRQAQWERAFLSLRIAPALTEKRCMFHFICPLHGYPGRRPSSALLGGNESCWHLRNGRWAYNLRVQGMEAASLSALKKPRSQVHDVAPSQTE